MKNLLILLGLGVVGYMLYKFLKSETDFIEDEKVKSNKSLTEKPEIQSTSNNQPSKEEEEPEISPYELEEILEKTLAKYGIDVSNGDFEILYNLGKKDFANSLMKILTDANLDLFEKKEKIFETLNNFQGNPDILNFQISLDKPVSRLSMRLDALRREYGIYGVEDPVELVNKLIPTIYMKGIEDAIEYLSLPLQFLNEASTEEEISKALEDLKSRVENLLKET